jgi:putative phosphoesterase
MKIAILSDIHDNLWNLTVALEGLGAADVLLCCGDLCSPFVMDLLAKFPRQAHIVFGNNDADLFRITRKSTERVRVHGEWFDAELGGRRIAMNHFDYLARPIAASGQFDVVCYGHNHRFAVERIGRTLLLNPGPIMGAAFDAGNWTETPPTFLMYDTQQDAVEAFEIRNRSVRPYVF